MTIKELKSALWDLEGNQDIADHTPMGWENPAMIALRKAVALLLKRAIKFDKNE